jgi:hypothetical protein
VRVLAASAAQTLPMGVLAAVSVPTIPVDVWLRPRSAWATALYGPDKLARAERRAATPARRMGV